jgi:hypothetical protein
MRNLGGHRFYDNPLPYRLEYPFVKGDVPNVPLDLVFDQFFASSGFSRVYQLDEVDATVSDTGPRVMSMFDLRVPNLAPTHYDDWDALDHQARRSLLLLALHIVSPTSCVGMMILPRSAKPRYSPRTPISSTVSSALPFSMGSRL